MMRNLKKIIDYYIRKINADGYDRNTWNIVWYNKDLK